MSTEEGVVFVVVAEGRRRRNLGGWDLGREFGKYGIGRREKVR